MNIKNSVFDYIRYKQLNWYGHVQRMKEEKFWNGVHLQEEREDLKICGWQEATNGMKGKGINSM